jgi:hypothetical protein
MLKSNINGYPAGENGIHNIFKAAATASSWRRQRRNGVMKAGIWRKISSAA